MSGWRKALIGLPLWGTGYYGSRSMPPSFYVSAPEAYQPLAEWNGGTA